MHARRLTLLGLVALAPLVRADEVRVLAAGAATHAIEAIAPDFERTSGHVLRASFDTVGAQRDRVLLAAPGTAADVVVLSESAVHELQAAGRVTGVPLPVGFVSVAIAVPAGRAVPNLSDSEHLRAALLAAPSIAYADPARGATAGTHFANTLEALGIRDAVASKTTVLPSGVDVVEAVAQGRYALGVSQSSEISNHPGVRLAGPLPPPHAQATGYAAARVRDTPAGQALLEYLRTPAAMDALRANGFAPAATTR
jgi:molybdate transport system substrate-binding protein